MDIRRDIIVDLLEWERDYWIFKRKCRVFGLSCLPDSVECRYTDASSEMCMELDHS